MTQEDKNLLLKYLCMALPYGVICEYTSIQDGLEIRNEIGELTAVDKDVSGYKHTYIKIDGHLIGLSDFKPYLRPMSSMTDEEKEQLKTLYDAENVTNESICFLEGGTLEEYEAETSFVFCYCVVEWLLEHHFDFMGLISKGLAIEVTKDNNPYKE